MPGSFNADRNSGARLLFLPGKYCRAEGGNVLRVVRHKEGAAELPLKALDQPDIEATATADSAIPFQPHLDGER